MSYYRPRRFDRHSRGRPVPRRVQAADADIDFGGYDVYMVFHAGGGQEADILQ